MRAAFARQFSLWREDAVMRDWVTAERDSALTELGSVTAERHGLRAERDSARAAFQAAAVERQGFLAERDDARAQLTAVKNSTSWKVTAPLRWTRELFPRTP